MACAFAPPYPKLLTPARRIPFRSGHDLPSVTTSTRHSLGLIFGLSLVTPCVGGMNPASSARATLIMLEMPLAASLWPMFVLIDPTRRGSRFGLEKARETASTSIGYSLKARSVESQLPGFMYSHHQRQYRFRDIRHMPCRPGPARLWRRLF